ncbi:similar to Saccharomyces cerevisiae YMR172W HOT1 Transcription factor required for the transient induction of glycerol biosynthetic genes GPD1 and GPP2 in response to high osmolarity [Maudiozyma saulgeensis]|uniref:Similar to Saccharomyces cerevisiae YMR172W HOT1 Transcription factor required for the transient induction of glycerol biosynthetic genes GPD1 and GPP2 in response to high osmolarity n=1 Tax=Maudiozyma saulgeensis TaxID=1789683 RepID=A0A1X7R063_9SACH|nr:similar to Saccharomyces cerevisiae YMR172W HOT1 Transcription factor required for the transient induction of glycerol biosynthetic genes GPD1 and GPP2 in response to high osmolarity [Kazachstania saulgeensis]
MDEKQSNTVTSNPSEQQSTNNVDVVVEPIPVPLTEIQPLDILELDKQKQQDTSMIENPRTRSPLAINYNSNPTIRSHSNANTDVNVTNMNNSPTNVVGNDIASVNSLPNLNIRQFTRNANITPSLSISSTNTESTSNQLRLFQRMEELSARLIAMEEQFQNLTGKIEQQTSMLSNLKLSMNQVLQSTINEQFKTLQKQNETMFNNHFHRMITSQQSMKSQQDDESKFALDLLNSISNISSNYLSQRQQCFIDSNNISMNDQTGQSSLLNKSNTNSNSRTNLHSSHSGTNLKDNTSSSNNTSPLYQLPLFTNRNKTFTLNPNGIKKRKRQHQSNNNGNHHHHNGQLHPNKLNKTNSNFPNNAPSTDILNMPIIMPTDPFTGLAPLVQNPTVNPVVPVPSNMINSNPRVNNSNGIPTLPHNLQVPLTLSHTNTNGNVKNRNNYVAGNNDNNGNGNNTQQQQQSQPNIATPMGLPISMQLPNPSHGQPQIPVSNPTSVQKESKNKNNHEDDDDDDGYQEDDESDNINGNSNKIGSTEFSKDDTVVGNTSRGIPNDDEDEDDDDNEEYDEEDDEEIPLGKTDTQASNYDDDDGNVANKEDDEDDDMDDENFEEDEVDEDINGTKSKNKKKKIVKKVVTAKKKRIIKKIIDGPKGSPTKGNIKRTEPEKDTDVNNEINYTLIKAPNNVRTIWEEYVYGINGNPSIRGLEEKYGNKWRLTKNRKTFSRRKRLYKFILNGIDKGKTADEMMKTLEEKRLYKDENGEIKRRTIGWLQQSLTGI